MSEVQQYDWVGSTVTSRTYEDYKEVTRTARRRVRWNSPETEEYEYTTKEAQTEVIEYTRGTVRISINADAICRRIFHTALCNKSGKSTLLHGLVKAQVIERHVEKVDRKPINREKE